MKQTAEQVASAVLKADEKLLWAGQPDSGRILTGYDMFMIPFSVVWTILWAAMTAITVRRGQMVSLMGLMFVLLGAYIFIARMSFKLKRKRQIFYALTDKRVIHMRRLKEKNNMWARGYEQIERTTISPGHKNCGSIYFYDKEGKTSIFFDVDDYERVYQLYRNQKKKS